MAQPTAQAAHQASEYALHNHLGLSEGSLHGHVVFLYRQRDLSAGPTLHPWQLDKWLQPAQDRLQNATSTFVQCTSASGASTQRSLNGGCYIVQCGPQMWQCLTRKSKSLMQHEDSWQGICTHRAIVQEGLLPLSHGLAREDENVRHHGAAAEHAACFTQPNNTPGQPIPHNIRYAPALSSRLVP